MKAAILAAGWGERLRAGGLETPKPLVRVGGRSLLEHALSAVSDAGAREALVVVNENTITDGGNYVLDTNPITQKVRLIIQRTHGAPDTGSGTFLDLLQTASEALPAVLPKNDDGSSAEPFSFMARNACLG